MTCRECTKFKNCKDRLGTTKYYDNTIACNDVEERCDKFKEIPPNPNKHRWMRTGKAKKNKGEEYGN